MGILIGGLLLIFGFAFFAMMWTTYGQYLFDGFIVPQVDQDGNRKSDVVKKLQAKKQEKEAKKKGEVVEENKAPKNRAANKKPNNQNTYNSSYKRKPPQKPNYDRSSNPKGKK